MPKPPLLRKSGLTGRWYIVTGYRETADGNIVAGAKWDVSEEVREMLAVAWDEGWGSRASRPHLKIGESVPAPSHINPYRKVSAPSTEEP